MVRASAAVRREIRARRQYLRWLDHGLVCHYVTPFLILGGTATGLLGLSLTLAARIFSWEEALDGAAFCFRASGLCLFLSALLAVPTSFCGLLGRPMSVTLLVGLGLLGPGFLVAAALVIFPEFGPLLFFVSLTFLVVAWVCWMMYLRELAPVLERPEVAAGAIHTLWGGLEALAIALPVGFLVLLVIVAMLKRPVLLFFVPVGTLGSLVTLVYLVGSFDSVTGFVLAPTGLPVALEYLNFISGLRVLIQRRC